MKMLCAILLVLLSAMSSSAGWYDNMNKSIEDSGRDYMVHAVIGSTVSGLSMYYLPEEMSLWVKVPISIGLSFLTGCAIETLDKNYDWKDVQEYGYGGTIGVLFTTQF